MRVSELIKKLQIVAEEHPSKDPYVSVFIEDLNSEVQIRDITKNRLRNFEVFLCVESEDY